MRKPLSAIVVFCCLGLLAASVAAARPRSRDLPQGYLPGSLDGHLVEALDPLDGTLWAAWAYRNGAEYDVAISYRDESGMWSEPTLMGVDDGLDQTHPALAVDNWGNVYLAYAERKPDRVMLTWLEDGTSVWSTPTSVTDPAVAALDPALRVVGDRLVAAFRTRRGLAILDLPLLGPTMIFVDGLQDTPDPVGAYNPNEPPDQPVDEDSNLFIPLDENGGTGWTTSWPD